MKPIITLFLVLMLPIIGASQSAERKKSAQTTLSKYSIQMDKNTKESISIPQSESVTIGTASKLQIFNSYYSAYLNSDAKNKDFNSLLKANELNPTNSELYFELAKYYELQQNPTKKKEFCTKLKTSKLSPALREYAYNTLMSVSQNGILVTYGEDDTYPIWVLQTTESIRKDVTVLNYDLMITEEYRNLKKKELGLSFSKSYSSNISILKDIAVKNKNKNIYYSLTVSRLILKQLKNNLYPTGLALKYSKKGLDNSQILAQNWESKFLKTYISNSTINSKDRQINMNYILPLLQLSNYYKENNRIDKYNQTAEIIRKIGVSGGKQKQVESLLKK